MGSSHLPTFNHLSALPKVFFMIPPLPPYLIFITVVLVILPSLVTIFLRISLYKYLMDLSNKIQRLIKKQAPGKRLKIIETLEERFKQASQQLEQVNTTALIDQVYSQEKIKGFTCEQIDYLCRILPNLLLAFGLLGTFLGITINLSTLSQAINQTNASDVSNLVAELKKPLEGMSIAFTTSLTGLLFSALLTVVNFIFNSGLAKYRLLSSLEDYLDNIYFPQVQGDTRLDRIVNRMVDQQDEFLTNFGRVVREAVEKSMGKVAQQIADGNKQTMDLARRVYEKFDAAAGTISGAADEFKYSINNLQDSMTEMQQTSQVFKDAAENFNKSDFPLKLSNATEHLSNTQQKFSESAASLAETTDLIINLLAQMESLSNNLINLGEDIKVVNQTSVQLLGLHQNNQIQLSEIIPQLQQGANSLSEAMIKLEQVEIKVSDKADSLSHVDVSLNQLLEFVKYNAELVKHNTEQMNLAFDNLGDHFISNLSQEQIALNQLLESVKYNTEQMNLGFDNLGDRFISNLSQEQIALNQLLESVKYNTEQMNLGFDNLGDRFISNLSQEQIALNQLLESVKYNTEQMNLAFDNLGDRFISHLSQNLDHNQQQFQTLINNLEGSTNQFSMKMETIKVDLINLLENNNTQLTSEYQKVNNNILQGINKQTNINEQGLEIIIKNIQECNKSLQDTKVSINQLRQVINKDT
ncbi:hypothetical protein SR1949_42890 [Sphaerospermopsis reniformis]|uniref:MotA/TolQ/ExbB proton channel domain-containing protein n=3 Tax=Aphanizomenonaceae TaxID=1892259 RepID=A0A480A5N3_9CYAN|nr:hypothetical protein SR1949_42890 [Sphaerospermopsis reniformis]